LPAKKEYLDYIQGSWKEIQQGYERMLEDWKKEMDTADTYYAPGAPLYPAVIEGLLYSLTDDAGHARRSRDALLSYAEFPDKLPDRMRRMPKHAKGIYPVTPPFGGMTLFLRAYEFIKDSECLSEEDRKTLEQIVANTAEIYFPFPEWGPHNRASKSGISLTYAAKMFPNHPQAPKWGKLGKLFMDGSWGHWSLEDTGMYCLIWLADLLICADVIGDSSVFESPMLKYYFDYFKNLFCPLGMIPDYGDSVWGSAWDLCMVTLEKGAAAYRDPYMKYTADRIFRQARETHKFSPYAIFGYLWADDSVEPKAPSWGSREVIDEVIGKKIVFRSGWDENATYMLLNYMDEGDIGWYYKEHLRNTLVVTAEKMHHGHADENSIVALIKNGSFLLHDSGYREGLPNGAYRSDVYHNRIVVRPGKPSNQSLFDFIRNIGIYQPVNTRRVHFKVFKDVDVSRTEVTDVGNGYHWNRVVTYLKGLEAFLIHDGVKMLRAGEFTVGNLLWTQQIHEAGSNHFDTSIDLIGQVGAWGNPRITLEERKRRAWPNKTGERLLIYFHPGIGKTAGTSEAMRCYLPEKCVHESCSRNFEAGDYVSFTTLLWPHKGQESTAKLLGSIESMKVEKYPRADAIRLKLPTGSVSICVKHDLSIGLVRPEMRPAYTYEAGRIQYGEIETDAAYAYAKLSGHVLDYAFIDGMKLFFGSREVFDSDKPSVYDLSHRPDLGREGTFKTDREHWEFELKTKWDSWEDTVQI